MKLFEPFLNTQQVNWLSFIGCSVVGIALTSIYAVQGQMKSAVVAIPICFLLWGFTHLTFADRTKYAFCNLPIAVQWLLVGALVAVIYFMR
jgi:hypothetical protein